MKKVTIMEMGLRALSVFFADQIFGHFFARHTTGADANASIHIFGRRKNTFDFDRSRFFCSFRREIKPFILVDLTFLFQLLEPLLFSLFLLFQIFFVVRTMSSAREGQTRNKKTIEPQLNLNLVGSLTSSMGTLRSVQRAPSVRSKRYCFDFDRHRK